MMQWTAEYEGTAPSWHLTLEAAKAAVDAEAVLEANGRSVEWTVFDGVHVQYWTHPNDDRQLGRTPGTVSPSGSGGPCAICQPTCTACTGDCMDDYEGGCAACHGPEQPA
jgi:hypothetical protein